MRVSKAGGSIVAVTIALAGGAVHSPHAQGQPGQAGSQVNNSHTTKEQFEGWMTQLSNWGRWGKDDQLGTVNLITPAKRKQAAALVKTGTAVSLSRGIGPVKGANAPNPFALTVTIFDENQWVMDRQEIYYHGITFTHLDALCHVAYKGQIYNGLSFRETVTKEGGCSKMGITGLKDGIVTRGILLDIPRLKGLPYLEPGTPVYREDVEAWEKRAGVKVAPGDAIFLRTGRWPRLAQGPMSGLAGYAASFAPFLKERDVALVGSDTAQEGGTLPGVSLPIHRFALVALGMNIFDNLDLEALAETAARLQRWEFLLMAAPSPVANGSGSPINPIAVF